ncbi:MAG: hypothetical protein EOP87_07730 [Verrucomicrobiaceae bacterium]|nr:MAG: hypothetical protein EOP87_07730 [Verrucomicrobiaceae bacterium]
MKHTSLFALLPLALFSCAGPGAVHDVTMEDPARTAVINAEGDKVLSKIPPLPSGRVIRATEPTFRSRVLRLPDGTWNVDFSGDTISITTPDKKVTSLPMTWYPEEGGADAALCQAIVSGRTTWIILQGTSDYYDETTRLRFSGPVLAEAIKHRIPGGLNGAVPADQRVRSQVFQAAP